ncbi:MAG: formylglycine-generating enzyme family protein [Cyanobacteria bacterium J06641_2]
MVKTVVKYDQGTAQYFVEDLGSEIELEMVLIPDGTFMMGAPENEKDSRDRERPQHQVTVPLFFMGKYQVTQAQWKAVAKLPQVERELKENPSDFKGDNRPVENVSWYDAVEFCTRLSNHTGREYRLPNEAEWEYACRAGTTTPFHFGETITTDLANYRGTDDKEHNWSGSYGRGPKGIYREQTTSVGSFEIANAFGLYNMHGNVWEWCLDDWHSDYENAPTDGSPWLEDKNDNLSQEQGEAVLRGGSWLSSPDCCRSAYRYDYVGRDLISSTLGFRVVCVSGMNYQ